MLLSRGYATRQGLYIDNDKRQRKKLEFVNGSFGSTCNMVQDADWKYRSSLDYTCPTDFYVSDGLQCDVLLSYDFLSNTDAFGQHQSFLHDLDKNHICDEDRNPSTITLGEEFMEGLRKQKRHFHRSKTSVEESEDLSQSTVLPNADIEFMSGSISFPRDAQRRLLQHKDESERSYYDYQLRSGTKHWRTFKGDGT